MHNCSARGAGGLATTRLNRRPTPSCLHPLLFPIFSSPCQAVGAVAKQLDGKPVKKIIFVPRKILNIIVGK